MKFKFTKKYSSDEVGIVLTEINRQLRVINAQINDINSTLETINAQLDIINGKPNSIEYIKNWLKPTFEKVEQLLNNYQDEFNEWKQKQNNNIKQ